jgi:uncharacterized membrane protein
MPVIELRGAIPVGLWMGVPLPKVLLYCVLGNMAPIIPLLIGLKSTYIQRLFAPMLAKASHKIADIGGQGNSEKLWLSIATFVGIPLPGTGAWTGAFGAFLLGMGLFESITAISAGVVTAGLIMSAITLSGKKGGIISLGVLGLVVWKAMFGEKKKEA